MMTTLMFLLAATLLVVCLLLLGALLGARSMLENANADTESIGRLVDVCQSRTDKLEALADQLNETIETLTKQRDDAIEEMTRITCELAVAKLSLKNARDQVADHVATTGRAIADREEYRDALKDVARRLLYTGDVLDEVMSEGKFGSEGG